MLPLAAASKPSLKITSVFASATEPAPIAETVSVTSSPAASLRTGTLTSQVKVRLAGSVAV